MSIILQNLVTLIVHITSTPSTKWETFCLSIQCDKMFEKVTQFFPQLAAKNSHKTIVFTWKFTFFKKSKKFRASFIRKCVPMAIQNSPICWLESWIVTRGPRFSSKAAKIIFSCTRLCTFYDRYLHRQELIARGKNSHWKRCLVLKSPMTSSSDRSILYLMNFRGIHSFFVVVASFHTHVED